MVAIDTQIVDQFSDWRWRLNNLYWIKDQDGELIPFIENRAQTQFLDEFHGLDIILKARQLGFSTLIQLLLLDSCLFSPNISAAVVAHRKVDAEDLFANKIKVGYDNLPEGLKNSLPAVTDSARKLTFPNGSSIVVDTSLRSGTFQYLHISEHGKICAQYPEKAREIRTGALNTVHLGQTVIIESTAEGRSGDFYDFCQRALRLQQQGSHLGQMDWRFHFFPWFDDHRYRLEERIYVDEDTQAYFERLEGEGVHLDDAQRAWFIKKRETQQEDMGREYPATPDEAFSASVEGAYYAKEMARARKEGRITAVPHDPATEVNTFWDLGINDTNVIWFHQQVGREHRLIDYYENSGEGLAHYAQVLKAKPYTYGTHYGPHDLNVMELGTGKTRANVLKGLGVKPLRVIPRTQDIRNDIQQVRNVFPACWFDERKCGKGIVHLDNYRKEWDEKLGEFKDRPFHDSASHGADGFRCFAVRAKKLSEAVMPEIPQPDLRGFH